MVTYNVITRIKALLINALIGLLVIVICSPKHNPVTEAVFQHPAVSRQQDKEYQILRFTCPCTVQYPTDEVGM
jgi:hypothetical protein